jgi:hypothetical protein
MTNQQKLYKIIEDKDNFPGWHSGLDGFPGTVNENGNYMQPYARELPEVFQGDAANDNQVPIDQFTRNLLDNYAVEGIDKSKDLDIPVKTGKFYLTKEQGKKLAAETICTHFSKCGAQGQAYLDDKYDSAFKYFDVNGDGRLDAVGISAQFMRFLCQPLGWVDIQ